MAAAAAGILIGAGHAGAIYNATGPERLSGAERAALIAEITGLILENPSCRWNLTRGSVQPVGATMTLFELFARSAGAGLVAADLVRIADRFTAHDVG